MPKRGLVDPSFINGLEVGEPSRQVFWQIAVRVRGRRTATCCVHLARHMRRCVVAELMLALTNQHLHAHTVGAKLMGKSVNPCRQRGLCRHRFAGFSTGDTRHGALLTVAS